MITALLEYGDKSSHSMSDSVLQYTNAPRRGEFLQPLPGCVSLFLFYPGVSEASPRLIPFRPARAEYVAVFHET